MEKEVFRTEPGLTKGGGVTEGGTESMWSECRERNDLTFTKRGTDRRDDRVFEVL